MGNRYGADRTEPPRRSFLARSLIPSNARGAPQPRPVRTGRSVPQSTYTAPILCPDAILFGKLSLPIRGHSWPHFTPQACILCGPDKGRGGVTADLRGVRLDDWIEGPFAVAAYLVEDDANGVVTASHTLNDPDQLRDAARAVQFARRGARRKITPTLLAEVAEVYRAHADRAPTEAVGRHFAVGPRGRRLRANAPGERATYRPRPEGGDDVSSIQERGARWFARYRDDDGREHARRFDRKVDAQRWLDEATAALQAGTYVDPKTARTTVEQWSATWLAGYATRRASTVRQAQVHLDRIAAAFGPMPLSTVRPSHVRAWTSPAGR